MGTVKEDLDKLLKAETVVYEPGMMVYHPLLEHMPSGGFVTDPEECAEILRDHAPIGTPRRHLAYAFYTYQETCQGLDIDSLIESASQDMHEDWYERVTDECKAEIAIAQATLDALHKRFSDFPTFRADFTKVVLLPILMPRKVSKGARK